MGKVLTQAQKTFTDLYDSYVLNLSSDIVAVPCDQDGKAVKDYTAEITYNANADSRSIGVTCTGVVANIMLSGIQYNTSTAGKIIITIPKDTVLPDDAETGFTFKTNNSSEFTFEKYITFVKIKSGTNAITFQIKSEQGNVFKEGIDSITMTAVAFDGKNQITSGASYQWAYYDATGPNFIDITNATNNQFTVSKTSNAYPSMVFRCTMTYNDGNGEKSYEDIFSLSYSAHNYEAVARFFDGDDTIEASEPFVVTYVDLYKDQQEEAMLQADHYYYNQNNQCDEDGAISIYWSGVDSAYQVDGQKIYAIYRDNTVSEDYASIDVQVVPSANCGTISGTGVHKVGDTITLTATANSGFQFKRWADNDSINSTRSVSVTGNATYTAEFEAVTTTISLNSNATVYIPSGTMAKFQFTPSSTGTYVFTSISGNNPYVYLYDSSGNYLDVDHNSGGSSQFALRCNLTQGQTYYFHVGLTDYTSSGNVTVRLSQDVKQFCTVTVSAGDGAKYITAFNERGVLLQQGLSFSLQVESGTTIKLSASPATNYGFLRWNDNDTQQTRSCIITNNQSYTAYFQYTGTSGTTNPFTASMTGYDKGTNDQCGVISSTGAYVASRTFAVADAAVYKAVADSGREINKITIEYKNFSGSSDITEIYDTFSEIEALGESEHVTINGSHTQFTFSYLIDSASLGATIKINVYFGQRTTPDYYYTITATPNDDSMGEVSGGGEYLENANATLTASAYSGYQFVSWNDGITENPRDITVTDHAEYVAIFQQLLCTIGVNASNAMVGDAFYIAQDAAGSLTWGKTQFAPGESIYCYAQAQTGRVITQVAIEENGVYKSYSADQLVGNGLNADHTIYSKKYDVTTSKLGTTVHFYITFADLEIEEPDITYPIITENVSTAASIVSVGAYTYLKFVPSQQGKYIFESLNRGDLDPCGLICDENFNGLQISNSDGGFSMPYDFQQGRTYYLGVASYTSTGSINVKVSYIGSTPAAPSVTDVVQLGNNTLNVQLSNNSGLSTDPVDWTWFSFTPYTDGQYTFTATSGTYGDTCGILSTALDVTDYLDRSDDGNVNHFVLAPSQQLVAGTTYYLGVKFYDPSREGTITVNIQQVISSNDLEISNISVGQTNVSIDSSGMFGDSPDLFDWTWFKFVPSDNKKYQFMVIDGDNDDTLGALYNADFERLIYDDDSAGIESHFLFEYEVKANTVYYLAIKFLDSFESGDVTVQIAPVNGGTPTAGVTCKISAKSADGTLISTDTVGLYQWNTSTESLDMSSYLGTQTVLTGDSNYNAGVYAKPGSDRKIVSIEYIVNGETTGPLDADQYYSASIDASGILRAEGAFYETYYDGYTFEYIIYFGQDSSSGGGSDGDESQFVCTVWTQSAHEDEVVSILNENMAGVAGKSDTKTLLLGTQFTIHARTVFGRVITQIEMKDSGDAQYKSLDLDYLEVNNWLTEERRRLNYPMTCTYDLLGTSKDFLIHFGDSVSGGTGYTTDTVVNGVLYIADGTVTTKSHKNQTNFSSVVFPSTVTTISTSTFEGCTGLTAVTLPNNLTTIGLYAFDGCNKLSSISIPNSVIDIGGHAFSECLNLTNVSMGSGVRTIGQSAFYGCTGLTSIVIGRNVTTINDQALASCRNLQSITIPKSVTTIGNSVSMSSPNISMVYYEGSEADWNNISIGSGNGFLTNASRTYDYVYSASAEPMMMSARPTMMLAATDDIQTYSVVTANKRAKYKAQLYQYNGTAKQWVAQSDINNYFYTNDLYDDVQSHVVVINKEDISSRKDVNFVIRSRVIGANNLPSTDNDLIVARTNITVFDLNDPVLGTEAPINPKNGQMWLNLQDRKLYVYQAGQWVHFDKQNGGTVYTSQPSEYKAGDLWILAQNETCGEFRAGTMLRATTNSSVFNPLHWVDAMSDVSNAIKRINESFAWSDENGLQIRQKVVENGQTKYPFYVQINSQKMGFYSASDNGAPDEVVHIGYNSAIINNASFQGTNGTQVYNQLQIRQNAEEALGFAFTMEHDGSFSIIKL